MSSFKRRSTKQTPVPIGTRILPASTSTFITSTGIPSLDDILGGGLPLSCSQLILAPDVHSAYGELVQKYFVAQGLAAGQRVCIVSERARDFLEGCMWLPGSNASSTTPAAPSRFAAAGEDDEDENAQKHDAKIKIAWRYEHMKQFQTTVSSPTHMLSTEDFCRVFDLTSRLPVTTIEAALSTKQLTTLDIPIADTAKEATRGILKQISQLLEAFKDDQGETVVPVRICIPALGSPAWGDVEPQDICYFSYALRNILRAHPYSCASVTLPPHLCIERWGGPGWVQKLGWLSDASISLTAFSADPSLTALFPTHHGFVHIHSLPAPSTLLPPSDRFSTLRGLTSSGENNLAFKCMRKRLIFETLHLDVEGGVGERRTTPAAAAIAIDDAAHDHSTHDHAVSNGGAATIQVQVEEIQQKVEAVSVADGASMEKRDTVTTTSSFAKKAKPRKKVAFTSDRPDLYDF